MGESKKSSAGELGGMGEFGLIAKLGDVLKGTVPKDAIGIGDDCAVLPAQDGSGYILLTTDTMLENQHFRWSDTSPQDLGWKLLAVNLSDIAAAGGVPIAAVLTLGLPPDFDANRVEKIYEGINSLAKLQGVAVVGGDTVKAEQFFVGAAVLGKTNNPLRRGGAQAGDELWVSGSIGDGGLGLALTENRVSSTSLSDGGALALERLHRPEPRLALGRVLSERRLATAAIDVSDGLIQDAGHICDSSKLNLEIDLDLVPHLSCSDDYWTLLRAASAGDDYELLFSAPAGNAIEIEKLRNVLSLPGLTRIGKLSEGSETEKPQVYLVSGGERELASVMLRSSGLEPAGGFNHFGAKK